MYLKTPDGRLVQPPVPDFPLFCDALREFKVRLLGKLPRSAPVDLLDFPALYTGLKRQFAQDAVDSLLVEPLTKKDALLKFFVKYEKLLKDSVPRVISPRSARYNAAVGRWLKPNEHRLFVGIARAFGGRTVMKGLDAVGVAAEMRKKWLKFKRPVAVGLDASRFDQHVSVAALKWEHSVYNAWFHDAEFAEFISWQLDNKGTGYTDEGCATVKVHGRRMSGDMNTSMGNCLLMCAMVYAYSRQRGVVTALANNGDDCVVFMEADDLAAFMGGLDQWFLRMGFNMKVEEPVFTFEHIEFCQAHPVALAEDTYIMVRGPVNQLKKDAMALVNANHPDSIASWCASIGVGGMAVYGSMPVLSAFYAYYARQGVVVPKWSKSYITRGLDFLIGDLDFSKAPVTDESRYSFYLAFGVFPDEQVELEAYFRGLPDLKHALPTRSDEISPNLIPAFTEILRLAQNAAKNT